MRKFLKKKDHFTGKGGKKGINAKKIFLYIRKKSFNYLLNHSEELCNIFTSSLTNGLICSFVEDTQLE